MGRGRRTAQARAVAALAVLAPVAAAGPALVSDHGGAVAASWAVRPGVEQVTVTGAEPGEPLTLYHDGDKRLTYRADAFGQVGFSYLPARHTVLQAGPDAEIPEVRGGGVVEPGRYVIRDDSARPPRTTASFRVLGRDEVPDQSLYTRQQLDGARLDVLGNVLPGSSLEDGFQYLEMRDGVTLSAMVRFPDPALYGNGPYPTVIEYSGYSPSNPAEEEPGVRLAAPSVTPRSRSTCEAAPARAASSTCSTPRSRPTATTSSRSSPASRGCCTTASGWWALLLGISQLYVASTRPPHLAAVLPLSVIADPYLEQWPGGIYNSGFAKQWLADAIAPRHRVGRAGWRTASPAATRPVRPTSAPTTSTPTSRSSDAPSSSTPRPSKRAICAGSSATSTSPCISRALFQDEQTGAQFNTMVDNFDHTPALRVALWNGRHPDGYAPSNIIRWFEFLEFYVAERVPKLNSVIRAAAAPILASSFNLRDTVLERDRWPFWFGTDYQAALRGYQAEQPVRVIYESGFGGNERASRSARSS